MTTPSALNITVNDLTLEHPWQWIRKGWEDFTKAPFIGLLHGIGISVAGLILLALAYDKFWILAGASTGFLAIAPVAAVGLYAVSRALEKNQPVNLMLVFNTWWSWRGKPHHDWRLVRFGLLLCLSGIGWVLTSAALITLLAPEAVNQPLDFFHHVVLSPDNYLFEIWLIVGGALGAPVFASTVVTLPLLMDRKISILDAVLVSWKVVLQNPQPMALWASLILGITMMGVLALIGSAIIIPVLGHASWHAYRDAVKVDHLQPRTKE